MSTLVEFLTARLDEDEAFARANALWLAGPEPWRFYEVEAHYGGIGIDPRRVLAEVAAKRAIIEWCRKSQWVADQGHVEPYAQGELAAYRTVLIELVRPCAEHPDFDPEWKLP